MPDGKSRGSRIARAIGSAIGVVIVVAALSGCGQQHRAVASIKVASAYVMQVNGTSALAGYLMIANPGPTDQLLSVRSSAGGTVLMLGPDSPGMSAAPIVSQLRIQGHGLTKLDPDGTHLEIVHSRRVREGTDVTLTLVFAHAGTIKVLAQVNNPATNSGGYLGP